MTRRYALYFAPADDQEPLARFGAWWLGRRPEDAAETPPQGLALPVDTWRDLTADPRGYGFHATLKAPFRLAPGRRAEELRAALADFAAARRSFVEPPLALATLHGFWALRPSQDSAAIADLAAACVRAFDEFRAPLTDAELRRRLAAPLTERQKALLAAWGYPYVFDDYRFHMTLTRRVDAEEAARLEPMLRDAAAEVLATPTIFAGVTLFEQAEPGAPFLRAGFFPFGV